MIFNHFYGFLRGLVVTCVGSVCLAYVGFTVEPNRIDQHCLCANCMLLTFRLNTVSVLIVYVRILSINTSLVLRATLTLWSF